MERLSRILNVLLVVCSITVPTTLILAAYFYYQNGEILRLKAELLSKHELQTELLKSQPLDHALIPHIDREIGYVLNPRMKRSTWRAPKDAPYPINALGLRGPEIQQKEQGITRVLLVGDSMFFGFKLPEEDKLSHILNEYTSRQLDNSKQIEFVTIALPGWNVRSETAFLERHLRLLDPDAIIWWTIANDLEDVAGVIPPGELAMWASPQAKHQTPFGGISAFHKRSAPVMPALATRQQDNWALIEEFYAKYGVPIVLMEPTEYLGKDSFNLPRIDRPETFIGHERWGLSATDRHPTGWANHILAMGILQKLGQLGIIGEIEFAPEDKSTLQHYADTDAGASTGHGTGPYQASEKDVLTWVMNTPTGFDSSEEKKNKGVLYGLRQDGEMARAGALFLRDPDNSSHLILDIALHPGMKKYPGTARFSIRNRHLEERHTVVTLNSESVEVKLPVPESSQNETLYEISWLFDYSNCRGPSACSSGNLQRARFAQ